MELVVYNAEYGDVVKSLNTSLTYKLYNINSIRESGWFIIIKVWNIYNGKIEIISFCLK